MAGQSAEDRFIWVECPRDAWQGLPGLIGTGEKVHHLQSLIDAGFRHLDLGSFVSPTAVPQMADTEDVLAQLERPQGADFLTIVLNRRGLERALKGRGVTSIGYPLSVNETFQLRNSGRDLAHAWHTVETLRDEAAQAGIDMVVYLSMGFGNPYGDEWTALDTAQAAARAADLGVRRIALADTVGTASSSTLHDVISRTRIALSESGWDGDLGVHLHSRPDAWMELVRVAWQLGIRWFEGALAGVGGCPFAGDSLVGNLPTEAVLPWLAREGNWSPVPLAKLPALAREAHRLASGATN